MNPCVVCEGPTDMLCSDCRLDLRAKVYVCGDSKCRDTHEEHCPTALRTRLAKAESEAAAFSRQILATARALGCLVSSRPLELDAADITAKLTKAEEERDEVGEMYVAAKGHLARVATERDEALGALAATVEQRSPCCGCAIRCGRCGNETRFVVSGHDALAAIRSQRDAHAHAARVRREALLDAAERLAETFPAQAVTQADWMGGRHDQHAADVAWLRARAEEK